MTSFLESLLTHSRAENITGNNSGDRWRKKLSDVTTLSLSTASSDLLRESLSSIFLMIFFPPLKADLESVRPHWLVFVWVDVGSSSQHAPPHTSECVCIYGKVVPSSSQLGQQDWGRSQRGSCSSSLPPLDVRLSVKMGLQPQTGVTRYPLSVRNTTLLGLFTSCKRRM